VDTWRLNATSGGYPDWFLVETNYDHWEPAPGQDDRRDVAIGALNALGSGNLTQDSLRGVMLTPKVLNPHTVYTAVMNPSTGELNATLWV